MSWNFEELTDGDVATCFSDLASKLNTLSRAAAATAKLMTRDQAGDTARGVFFLRDDSAPLPAFRCRCKDRAFTGEGHGPANMEPGGTRQQNGKQLGCSVNAKPG